MSDQHQSALCFLFSWGLLGCKIIFPALPGKEPILSKSWLQMKAAKMKLPSGMMECNEPRILDSILQTTVMTGSFSCGQQGFNKDHVLKQLLSSSHLQAMLRRQHSASARSCWSINGLGSYKCDKCVTSSSAKYVEFAGNTDANNACWSCWGSLGWPKPLSIYIYTLPIYIYTYIINNVYTYVCKIYKLTTKWIKYSYSVQVCPSQRDKTI